MSDSGSLHKAGRVGLLEQLLRVGHQARILQQTSLLRHLGGHGLLLPVACSLQGHSQSTLTLRYSCSQLSGAVVQLIECHGAVRLERSQPKMSRLGGSCRNRRHTSGHHNNRPIEGQLEPSVLSVAAAVRTLLAESLIPPT